MVTAEKSPSAEVTLPAMSNLKLEPTEESKGEPKPNIDRHEELYAAASPASPPLKTPKIYTSVADLIGGTPLLELHHITQKDGAHARIVAKVEGLNPGASVKDRIALGMIEDAEAKGLIKPGVSTLIEPTSGNTGIALAMLGVPRGYRVIMVMPHSASIERKMVVRGLGAEVVLVDVSTGGLPKLLGYVDQLLAEIPNSHKLDQFSNPQNPVVHFKTTGPEIWEATEGKVDIFVGVTGTGGTITGVGRYLKKQNAGIKIIAVEPAESAVMQGGQPGPHPIQGTGPGFVPVNTEVSLFDEILSVSGKDALTMARRISVEEGLLVGISSGSAVAGALKLAKRPENAGKLIVTLLPSMGERYLSTVLFTSIKEEMDNLKIV
ncbi:unnamed protein product [Calypogeia fissa]